MFETRNRFMKFRVTENEYQALELISRREGVCMSEAGRIMLREAIAKRGMLPVGLISLEALNHKDEARNGSPA